MQHAYEHEEEFDLEAGVGYDPTRRMKFLEILAQAWEAFTELLVWIWLDILDSLNPNVPARRA